MYSQVSNSSPFHVCCIVIRRRFIQVSQEVQVVSLFHLQGSQAGMEESLFLLQESLEVSVECLCLLLVSILLFLIVTKFVTMHLKIKLRFQFKFKSCH